MAGPFGSKVDTTKINDDGNGLLLYQFHPSYCCQKVAFALHEKKLKFKTHFVDLFRGEQFEPSFLQLNPKSEVPVLKDGVKIIPDSRRIIDYLEDNFSNGDTPRLIPKKGTPEFHTMELLRDLIDNLPFEIITFGCLFNPEVTGNIKMSTSELKGRRGTRLQESQPFFKEGRYVAHIALLDELAVQHKDLSDQYMAKKNNLQKRHTLVTDIVEVKKALKDLEYVLNEVEKELATHVEDKKKWWLCSEQFTIADVSFGVLLHRIRTIDLSERYFKGNQFPHVREYFKRIQQRESYRRMVNQGSGILKTICCLGNKDTFFMTLGSAAVVLCAVGVAAFLLQRKK